MSLQRRQILYPVHFWQPGASEGKFSVLHALHSSFVSKHGCLRSILQTDHGLEAGQLSHTLISKSSPEHMFKRKVEAKNSARVSTPFFITIGFCEEKVFQMQAGGNDAGQEERLRCHLRTIHVNPRNFRRKRNILYQIKTNRLAGVRQSSVELILFYPLFGLWQGLLDSKGF